MIRVEFSIRSIEEKDYDYIAKLCGQLGYPATSEQVKPRIEDILIRENHQVFVAETTDGKVVGWVHIHLYPLLESDLMAEIGGLVVDEKCRGNGVGRELMRYAEEWAQSKGCTSVSLRSNVVRSEAHAFYKSIGYERVKGQYTFRRQL